MVNIISTLGNIRMDTPLVAVSGVWGLNYEKIIQSRQYVGAVITKSVTLLPRMGNPEPKIVELQAGMLNSIGIQNAGIKAFIEKEIPEFRTLEIPVIASVAGSNIEEYVTCASLIAPKDEIAGIELNVSCPNVEAGGIEFGCTCNVLEQLVSRVRKSIGTKTLIVKLTPNVTDIAEIAQAAINGGADVLSLINTLRGMAIDLHTQKPILGNRIGGLSGTSIHPVAVYMVYRTFTACCKKAHIPILGIGGVSRYEDAMELILAGATSVGIGTALFRNSNVFKEVTEGIQNYLKDKNVENINMVVGISAVQNCISFSEIASFLNIAEAKAHILGSKRLLPGYAIEGGWCTTLEEVENWYNRISGQEWANLVNNGVVDTLDAEIQLSDNTSLESIANTLQNWQKFGLVEISEQQFDTEGSITWKMRFTDQLGNTSKHVEDIRIKKNQLQSLTKEEKELKSILENISLTYEAELIIKKQTLFLSLSPSRTLKLKAQDNLFYLLQRDREIIRFFLRDYLGRIIMQSEV